MLDELFVSEFDATMDVGPHVHREHIDSFFVLERDFTFDNSGEEVALESGSYALAPPLLVHGFRPGGRILNIHAPGRYWVRRQIARREGRRIPSEEYDAYPVPADGGLPRSAAVVVPPGEGEALANDQRTIRIKVARPELCLFEFDSNAGHTGPPPHVHREHVDAFYVLEGELEFLLDGETVRAPAGTFVAAPPGVVHTFRNASGRRACFLNIHAPGMRYDEYFRRQAARETGDAFHASYDSYDAARN